MHIAVPYPYKLKGIRSGDGYYKIITLPEAKMINKVSPIVKQSAHTNGLNTFAKHNRRRWFAQNKLEDHS